MSYAIEHLAISNLIMDNSAFGLSPFGIDGEKVAVTAGAGFMSITNGAGGQTSMGSPEANLHDYAGVLAVVFFKAGGQGSKEARALADQIVDFFTGRKIDEDQLPPRSGSDVVIDFARNGLAPYLAECRHEGDLLRTVVNAPFIRTERK